MPVRYVALTSGRNEERYIREAIEGVISQSIKPATYVVVDDSSTDKTYSIISEYDVEAIRLRNRRHPVRGVNLALALNAGLRRLNELVPDWEYLLKVDADSVLPPDYFQNLLAKFEENPRLGITSGTPYDEKVWRGRASDGAKIYRRGCLDAIESFRLVNAFDTHALLEAKRNNWVVQSYPEFKYTQLRTWRRGRLSRWILSGRSRYYLGFPSWHTFLISFEYATDRPPIIGSVSMFLSHLLTSMGSPVRPFSDEYYDFVSRYAVHETLERIHERRLR